MSRSSVTTFNQNTTNVFQSLAFRSGVAGQNQLTGIITSVLTPSYTFSSLDRAVGPHNGKDLNVSVQVAGMGGNVKYVSPIASYRQFFPMKGLKVNREGHNVLGYRRPGDPYSKDTAAKSPRRRTASIAAASRTFADSTSVRSLPTPSFRTRLNTR